MIFGNYLGNKVTIASLLKYWPVLLCSFICALAATWLCKRIAIKFGIVDKPDNLVKTHKEPVAYLGGIGILVGLVVGVFTGLYLCIQNESFHLIFRKMLGILTGAAIACAIGVVDDIFDISPKQKLTGQIVAAFALVVVGIVPNLSDFYEPFGWDIFARFEFILGVGIVVFFVLGATNSLNLLDGLDGLCAGVTAIITLALLALAVHLSTWGASEVGDPVRIIVCLALVGGVFGFLPFNRHPAKIFMGDAGSMLLGFCVAALMMLFAEDIPRWWMASIVVFGLPILDTATAMVRRFLNKKPLFVSDRGHIYDQLIDRGIPLQKTVLISYTLAALYALVGVSMSLIRTRYALVVYILVFLISAFAVWKLGFLKMEGLRGAIRKQDPHRDKPQDRPEE